MYDKRYELKPLGSNSVYSQVIIKDEMVLIFGFDKNENQVIKIEFEYVVSIRVTEEGGRVKYLSMHSSKHDAMIICESSEYIDWIDSESNGIRPRKDNIHYIILVGDSVIDVISPLKPNIVNY